MSVSTEQELRWLVLSCMLWGDAFYEDGMKIADRITQLCNEVDNDSIAALALEARTIHHLRHGPLLLLLALLRKGYTKLVSLCDAVIQNPDDLTELLTMYWRFNNNKKTIAAPLKRGLAEAFTKLSAFQISRYTAKNKGVAIRDVLRLVHPVPMSDAQSEMWRLLSRDELRIAEDGT